MSKPVWNVMVAVQQARRGREERTTTPTPAAPRRKRPTTLRSIRKLIVDDHYALLAEGSY